MRAAPALFAVLAAVPAAAPPPVTFNDDGGWCWFQDERALIVRGRLVIGSVAAGVHDPARRGDIEVVTYDLRTGRTVRYELHDRLQLDDHNAPALLALPDGRLLAVYAKHGPENRFYYRISAQPYDFTRWQDEQSFSPKPHVPHHLLESVLSQPGKAGLQFLPRIG